MPLGATLRLFRPPRLMLSQNEFAHVQNHDHEKARLVKDWLGESRLAAGESAVTTQGGRIAERHGSEASKGTKPFALRVGMGVPAAT